MQGNQPSEPLVGFVRTVNEIILSANILLLLHRDIRAGMLREGGSTAPGVFFSKSSRRILMNRSRRVFQRHNYRIVRHRHREVTAERCPNESISPLEFEVKSSFPLGAMLERATLRRVCLSKAMKSGRPNSLDKFQYNGRLTLTHTWPEASLSLLLFVSWSFSSFLSFGSRGCYS